MPFPPIDEVVSHKIDPRYAPTNGGSPSSALGREGGPHRVTSFCCGLFKNNTLLHLMHFT